MNAEIFAPVFYNELDLMNKDQEKQPEIVYRCRNCNSNLASNDPASQYQRQKIIQKTVRVPSSLYTMNLGALSTYKKPLNNYQKVDVADTIYISSPGVNWNQMSDKPRPANQTVKTGSGSTYGASSTRHTIVRNRPGAMSPGGVGVDIKHNSYDRYLNRIKGKAPLRRGIIPVTYGLPVAFNNAYPIYGGKTIKTAIVNDCDCPDNNKSKQNQYIYSSVASAIQDNIYSVNYHYNIGDYVWARKYLDKNILYKGQIIGINNGIAEVKFDDLTITYVPISELTVYYKYEHDNNGLIINEVECLVEG